jgi:aminoglycoside phosphotransferase (APT) family kinase protein
MNVRQKQDAFAGLRILEADPAWISRPGIGDVAQAAVPREVRIGKTEERRERFELESGDSKRHAATIPPARPARTPKAVSNPESVASCGPEEGFVPDHIPLGVYVNVPVWAADIEIDAALAARLVREQFPELAARRVVAFGRGWDNAAFLVGGEYVFRFPRRRIAVPLMRRETALLGQIAPHVPLAIPAPAFVGVPSDAFSRPFAGYRLIAGVTACSVPLSDEARAAMAEPLAHFLRALHAIDPAPLVAAGLPPDEIGRLDGAKRLRLARERLPSLVAAGVTGLEAFVEWLVAHPPAPLPDAQRRVLHGDLYHRHVVLDGDLHPAGVIDWGDVHLGDPALDIAIAHMLLPARAHAAFREAYGAIDERTWSAARYRAIYHAILEIDYGIREDDAGMRASGSAALNMMRDSCF